ncbi:ribose-phosphate pyrophosphokinase [Alkalispirochaeta sphaeroplastigenens]|uniref:ribose-phosphate diphosphokinase n=1 Tax=Alkalispirochaeta sphaeroplastigenens TaxID=1187066 RepID=A0A2S4K0C1_9SPIO|nr:MULTISPECIES: ribose-phosphate diphosphokinase [Alkalispirochaeta]POR05215.1 ribose-phosphate pyrophosphokinase [Alkalispirochaeta sphaeroplastigenens]
MRGELVIFATRSMEDYADRVAYEMQTFPDFYGKGYSKRVRGELRTITFADGEMEVEVHTSIRGKDVVLFASAGRNSGGYSVEQNKMEMYHAIDAIRRAQPSRITLFEPFCTSSRSDRTTRRNSVGFWIHYKTLASLGVDHIITYQLHSDKSKTVVDPCICAIDDVPGSPLLKEYITDNYIRKMDVLNGTVKDDWLFCSVDAGGESVARKFARAFGTRLMIAHKQRNYDKTNTVESINILTDTPIEGKEVWIVDDMIDTGGSIFNLVQELKHRGVKTVNIAVVHPVFSDPATERLQDLYDRGMLDRVVVTDSVDVPAGMQGAMPFLEVVSSARLSAEIIMHLHEEQSLSPFFDTFDPRHYLSNLKLFL